MHALRVDAAPDRQLALGAALEDHAGHDLGVAAGEIGQPRSHLEVANRRGDGPALLCRRGRGDLGVTLSGGAPERLRQDALGVPDERGGDAMDVTEVYPLDHACELLDQRRHQLVGVVEPEVGPAQDSIQRRP